MNNKATLLLTLAAFIVLANCAKSSTGRNQITLFSSSDLNKMGDSSFEQMKKKSAVILR